jgi:hypothetical protein
MRAKRMLLIILVSFVSMLCISGGILMCKGKRINANGVLFLEEKEIVDLSEKAKKGDSEAALSLGSYYSMIEYDRDRAAEWYKQGADNGNVICQYNYALYLMNNGDEKNMNDAINYLKKANEKGFAPAKKKLEKMGIVF